MELELDGEQIKDIAFSGQACAICMASSSMMTEAIKGKDLQLAKNLQAHFRAVLTGETDPDDVDIGKLVALSAVRRYPSRIKCALLGWHALMHAITGQDGAATTETTQAGA